MARAIIYLFSPGSEMRRPLCEVKELLYFAIIVSLTKAKISFTMSDHLSKGHPTEKQEYCIIVAI
jgi:hypothetical protein